MLHTNTKLGIPRTWCRPKFEMHLRGLEL